MKYFIVGDLNIPNKKAQIPAEILDKIKNIRVDKIICTGNLTTKSQLDFLKTLSNDIIIVRGEFDNKDITDKYIEKFSISNYKVALMSGFKIIPPNNKEKLVSLSRELDVDILIFGSENKAGISIEDGKAFLNPGSATGSSSKISNSMPSFILAEDKDNAITIHFYYLEDGKLVHVEEIYSK